MISNRVMEEAAASSFQLIETLAEHLASLVLQRVWGGLVASAYYEAHRGTRRRWGWRGY